MTSRVGIERELRRVLEYSKHACLAMFWCAISAVCCLAEPAHQTVSMVALISHPQKYAGTLMRVTGYVVFKPESNILYLGQYDAQEAIDANGVPLDISALDEAKLKHWKLFCNYETVTIEGRFEYPAKKGHLPGAAYSNGEITNITDMRLNRSKSMSCTDRPRAP
jgi:hypothetical protein